MQPTLTLTDIATDGGCPSVTQWKTGAHPYCQPLPTLVDSHWGSSTFWKFHPPLSSLVETHSSTPRLADWLWTLIDNRSSKSPPLWNCSVFIGNMADIIVVVKASLNLHYYCFWCCCTSIFHCTTPSSNLVTAVHDDSNPVEIFIFTRKEISTELDKILPICFCSNPVQSLAELNQVSGWTKKYPMCQWYSIPPRYTIPPPSGLNWTTLAKANQAKAQLQTQGEFLRIGENLKQFLLSLLARGKSGWH